ncbi:hypothetical protein LTR66_002619 [Elasticomyces elasticus]|nr:hypothetical protein LTR66_002619 [Elasticomyces elasticus]
MADPVSFLDLPLDILMLVFPYLDPKSFLSLCSTCTALHQPDISLASTYWSVITRSTFRLPNRPMVQNDGRRWQKLYKRLLTQSRAFTWGQNAKGCLGHSYMGSRASFVGYPPPLHPEQTAGSEILSCPTEMDNMRELGTIADMQCGGWSTTLLTSVGALYSVGAIDGGHVNRGRPPFMQQSKITPTRLQYPPGFVPSQTRYDPYTAVQQFSAGRSHVLALTDSRSIWSWNDIDHPGYRVKFLTVETREGAKITGKDTVKKVIAGWNKSSALVIGTGIVLWDPLARSQDETAIEDAALVLESATVPRTAYIAKTRCDDPSLVDVGEVSNYIVLEHYVVFNTNLGKVFASRITWDRTQQAASEPVELPLSRSSHVGADQPFVASDVQGSFRSFAVFGHDGTVLVIKQAQLDSIWSRSSQAVEKQDLQIVKIPALQHKGVVSLAFGDYHMHALHNAGHISSYGTEPQACGALGLSASNKSVGRLRGVRYDGLGGDGKLLPHCYTSGRRIWFEREKRLWMGFMACGGVDLGEARGRLLVDLPDNDQGELSEWFEQQGNAWTDRSGVKAEDEDGLGAYFALSVTAAGWHSGALVLVNHDLADRMFKGCVRKIKPEPEDLPSSLLLAHDRTIQGFVARMIAQTTEFARWFLGLPPSARESGPEVSGRPYMVGFDGPAEGYEYIWRRDHFPRLRLRNGTEMPGQIPFSEWKQPCPEFDLDIEF